MEEKIELYKRVKNEKRKLLLSFIYEKPRNYKEIKELLKLNPGSLYHHLSVLDPLVIKTNHGVYEITAEGREVVEALNLTNRVLPKVSTIQELSINRETPVKQDISDEIKPLDAINAEKQESQEEIIQQKAVSSEQKRIDLLELIWLSKSTYGLIGLVIIISIFLSTEGIALSGSALYAVGGTTTSLIFDLFSLSFGIFVIYFVENITQKYPVYSRTKFLIIIRAISMVPGALIGIGLLMLFQVNVVPSETAFVFIYLLSLFSGFGVTVMGISYLRSEEISNALLYAVVIHMIDVFLGGLIMITNNF